MNINLAPHKIPFVTFMSMKCTKD